MRIEVPQSWSHITIRQLTELYRLDQLNTDEVSYMIESVAILTNTDREDVRKLSVDQVAKIVSKMSFINNLKMDPDYKAVIEVNGKRYNGVKDLTKINAGAYIDLKEFTKDNDEIIFNLENIIACFYRGKRDHKEVADEFYNHLTVDVAYPLALFFCQLYQTSILHTRIYLEMIADRQKKKALKMLIKNSENTGAGLRSYTP